MNADESIFICDPPPGARWILKCAHALSQEQAESLKAEFERVMANTNHKVIVLAPDLSIDVLPGRYEWPDAEFCAA